MRTCWFRLVDSSLLIGTLIGMAVISNSGHVGYRYISHVYGLFPEWASQV